MDLITWYYTLSTIAQTLAAVLGIGAVFVTLRLQSVANSIEKYREMAYEILLLDEDSTPRDESAKSVRDTLKTIVENYADYGSKPKWGTDLGGIRVRYNQGNINLREFVSRIWNDLDRYIEQRDKMITLVKWPGVSTFSAIIISLLLLASTDWWAMNLWGTMALLLEIVLTIFSLLSTARASWKLLGAVGVS
jgi:hypothetical protein